MCNSTTRFVQPAYPPCNETGGVDHWTLVSPIPSSNGLSLAFDVTCHRRVLVDLLSREPGSNVFERTLIETMEPLPMFFGGGVMKAVRVERFGGPNQVAVEGVPVPVAGAAEILVRVMASGKRPGTR
jgi:hypothetical protein